MNYVGKSIHHRLSGKIVNWLVGDSQEIYNHNLKHHYDLLESNGWLNRTIDYSFNRHGFRSEEFSSDDSIVFLGASDTLGVGLPIEYTWCHIVAQELKLKMFNLGQGGSSGCTAFRLASYWIPILKPKVVILMSPLNPRIELISDSLLSDINTEHKRSYYQMGPHVLDTRSYFWSYISDHSVKKELQSFYHAWSSSELNLTLMQQKNNLAISMLAQQSGSKFILACSEKDWKGTHGTDYSRDLQHCGMKGNQIVAELILDRVSKEC